MQIDQKIKSYLENVKKIDRGEKLDLSSSEDLVIGIMNLIAIEEHLFFSGGKTGKTKYYDLINEVRQMRVYLMKQIIKEYEGEEWCIAKHLLSASMRVMEVGTKAQKKGDNKLAYDYFKKSYDLFNLFWGMRLGLIDKSKEAQVDQPVELASEDLFGKINNVIKKVLDCCRE